MIATSYHGDLKEVQADPALAALLRAPQARTPFDRTEWWQGLIECCGYTPAIAVARRGEDRAVLPLAQSSGRLQSLCNWYSFSTAPLFTPGADRAALLTALAADLAKRTGHLSLAPIPDDQGEATALLTALRRAGWLAYIEPCDANHVLPVNGRSFAEYIAGRPGPLRSTLRRKQHLVDVTIHQAFDARAWSSYEAIYAASWKGEEGCPGFLRGFAQQEGAAGRLRLALAHAEGRPVAAQLWTIEAGTAFIHKLAYVRDACALSPGTTLTAALLEQVIDRDGVALVDFGTGDDPFKRDWMEAVRPRYRIEAFRRERPSAWPRLGRELLRRVAAGRAHG